MKGGSEGDLERGRRASEPAARMKMMELQSRRRRLADLQKNWEIARKLLGSFLQAASALKDESLWSESSTCADIAAPMEAIERFLARYNSAASIVSAFCAAPEHELENGPGSTGLTSGSVAKSILRLMRTILDARRTGPGLSSLSQLGLGVSDTGPGLSVLKEDALTNALQNDLEAVRDLFADETDGIATRMQAMLEVELQEAGLLAQKCEDSAREIADLERSISQVSERLRESEGSC